MLSLAILFDIPTVITCIVAKGEQTLLDIVSHVVL